MRESEGGRNRDDDEMTVKQGDGGMKKKEDDKTRILILSPTIAYHCKFSWQQISEVLLHLSGAKVISGQDE